MTQKFDAFKADLIALCDKHGVTIAAAGYEGLQVWDRDLRDGPIYDDHIKDCTVGAQDEQLT